MPKHTYWLTYLLDKLPALKENARNTGDGFVSTYVTKHPQHPDYHTAEPIITAMLYMVVILVLAMMARTHLKNTKAAAVPSDRLTLPTIFEVFFGYFYNLAKDVMGPVRAKEHFPLIAGSAGFIIFCNLIGLVPGFSSPTSNLNVTLGCATVVFLSFNYHGIRTQGVGGYFGHMAGPMWFLAPLIFPIEVFSTCMRVVTLSIRLMVNIAVDHLLGSIFLALVAIFVPIPLMVLGLLVCLVQALVFALLATVYIGLATEDTGHGDGGHEAAHAH